MADGNSEIAGGNSTLEPEKETDETARRLSHDQPGLVSLVVREELERPVKEKLVALGLLRR